MVLLLATHTVEVPTARVPLSIIILNDAIKRRSIPPSLKCRVVIPSSGHHSVSLWDATSVEELQQWIEANLNQDCVTSVAEVAEDFTYGLSLELATSRAADKVATSSKNTLERINTTGVRVLEVAHQTLTDKLERLDARTNLITATREATSAAAAKVRAATDRAIESEGVQSTLASISTGLATAGNRMGRAFTWVGSKVKEQVMPTGEYAAAGPPFGDMTGASGDAPPPSYEASYGASPYMPVSTNAAQPSAEVRSTEAAGAEEEAAGPAPPALPMAQFTLDEGPASPLLQAEAGHSDALPASHGAAAEEARALPASSTA